MVVAGSLTTSPSRVRDRAPDCTGPPKAILYVSRYSTPRIAEHIAAAQAGNGAWRVLCRNGLSGPGEPRANRQVAVCGRLRAPRDDESCDEYPFASTYEGGEYASYAVVPKQENDLQVSQLSTFYAASAIRPGDRFGVLFV